MPSVFVFLQNDPETDIKKIKRFESAKKRRKTKTVNSNKKSVVNKNTPSTLDITPFAGTPCDLNTSMSVDFRIVTASTPLPNKRKGDVSNGNISLFTSSIETSAESTYLKEISELRRERDEQNEMLEKYSNEISNLRQERDNARKKLSFAESKFLSYNKIKINHKKVKYYTGITAEKFDAIFNYLQPSLPETFRCKMSFEDQFLMTLVKLRLDLQFENLADQFNCATSSAHGIFQRWIDLLYTKLQFLIKWPDHDAGLKTLPHVFRQYFPRLTGIIDCTEIFIHRPMTT